MSKNICDTCKVVDCIHKPTPAPFISNACSDCKYHDVVENDYPCSKCIHIVDSQDIIDRFEPNVDDEPAVCGENRTREECSCQECFVP